jgi:multidrug efflux pump subunit AcrB
VVFSVLSNMIAFAPMFFVPGISGKFFRVIPLIAISVFFVSLIESLFILPAHLAHQKPTPKTGYRAAIRRGQRRFGKALTHFVNHVYQPLLEAAVKRRYLTLAVGFAIMILVLGLVVGGRIRFSFMPKIDTDLVTANATLTFGSPVEDTERVAGELLRTAREVIEDNGGENILRGILMNVGNAMNPAMGPMPTSASTGGHLAAISIYMVPSKERDISATEFVKQWRGKMGGLAGLESLTFDYSAGPAAGSAIDIELRHRDIGTLEAAAADLAARLGTYNGVTDIDDGFSAGKPQLDFKVRPEAGALGVTAVDLGNQMRAAFYGARAFRQQRGREEIWVMVRLPESERRSEYEVEHFMIRTPGGGEMPLTEAAMIERGSSYTEIKRVDGRRVVNVTADVNIAQANANEVLDDVLSGVMPEVLATYPGLSFGLEGERREQRESMSSLLTGFVMAMLVIFAMLAIPFRSYVQPFAVIIAVPFGIVGAVIGHMIMGFDLSVISTMGIVALSGVVVNDSLVLIHKANENISEGMTHAEAIIAAGNRRFRPIILTSLTTFFGLAPMMFETSVEARFLIPMAISLGFGILFATAIILLLVPSLFMIIEDAKDLTARYKAFFFGQSDSAEATT